MLILREAVLGNKPMHPIVVAGLLSVALTLKNPKKKHLSCLSILEFIQTKSTNHESIETFST